MENYRFCPNCKSSLTAGTNKVTCRQCGFEHYDNQQACVSVVPIKDGRVLLSIRKYEPYKGEYDLIGGFLEPNEYPAAGAVRETKEETGLNVKITKLIGIYPDVYGEDGKYTLNINYLGEVQGGEMEAKDDVAELMWIPIEEIPNLKINSFNHVSKTLNAVAQLYST